MALNRSHVEYVLAQFDIGVPPLQILSRLQYRAFLPSVTVVTIERCLRENGRVLNDQRAGNKPQGNRSIEIGHASTSFSLANHVGPGPSTLTQESSQLSARATMRTYATADEHFVNPAPTMQWDALADSFALAAHRARKPLHEILTMLRSNGYDITLEEVLTNLTRQGVPLAR